MKIQLQTVSFSSHLSFGNFPILLPICIDIILYPTIPFTCFYGHFLDINKIILSYLQYYSHQLSHCVFGADPSCLQGIFSYFLLPVFELFLLGSTAFIIQLFKCCKLPHPVSYIFRFCWLNLQNAYHHPLCAHSRVQACPHSTKQKFQILQAYEAHIFRIYFLIINFTNLYYVV